MKPIKIIFIKGRLIIKRITEVFFLFLLFFFKKFKLIKERVRIRSIVIPLISGIGDTVIFTSCLQGLDKIFPHANITILTTDRTQGILDDTYPNINFLKLTAFKDLLKLRRKFDLMVIPSRKIKHYVIAFIIHPRYLVGYNFSLSIKRGESHIARANRILHQLGYIGYNDPFIRISDAIVQESYYLIRNVIGHSSKAVISLIVGGRWKSKIYSPLKYRLLVDQLIRNYKADVLLIGDNIKMGDFIARDFKKVYNLVGKTSIQEAMGIICNSDFIIGPDGGLLNIAIAMNKNIIGIFGPVDPITIVPDKFLDQILFDRKCEYQPCYNEEHEPLCPYHEAICMNIEVGDIIDKLEYVIGKNEVEGLRRKV